jgi:nucleoside-diphosphate-sugar epimerase
MPAALSGEKILITGPAGRIAFPIAAKLAQDNEVWGIARFSNPAQQAEVEALGVTTRKVDLVKCDFGDLPRDFTYVLHIAASFDQGSYDQAITVNAEACGFVLDHCRSAKAALIMSTLAVYKPTTDPWHAFQESDALGDMIAHNPDTYSIAKNCEEAIARFCARNFNLPVTIARMGSAYGDRGGLPIVHMHDLVAGRLIEPRWDPLPYSPIHVDDIADMIAPLLGAASVPATIVNFCGDDAVAVQQWIPYMADLLGVTPKVMVKPVPGASLGSVGDITKRLAITGPTKVKWQDGLKRVAQQLYPDRIRS